MKQDKVKANKKKEVIVYFTDEELARMKQDTGADKNGTAVAAFIRKRFAKTV